MGNRAPSGRAKRVIPSFTFTYVSARGFRAFRKLLLTVPGMNQDIAIRRMLRFANVRPNQRSTLRLNPCSAERTSVSIVPRLNRYSGRPLSPEAPSR